MDFKEGYGAHRPHLMAKMFSKIFPFSSNTMLEIASK